MNIFQSLKDYLRDSKSELEKVSWPSRQDTIRYSGLVLGVSVVVAAFFASLDYGLDAVVAAALNRKTVAPVEQPAQPVTPLTSSTVPGLDIEQATSSLFQPGEVQTAPATSSQQPAKQ